MKQGTKLLLSGALALALVGCGDNAQLPEEAGIGTNPTLPTPDPPLIPTVNVAPAKGWPAGATPNAAEGVDANAFATGLDHPRWLYVLPNGDVLVAQAKAPPNRQKAKESIGKRVQFFLHQRVTQFFMQRAGASGPSPNRITLLRDADGDGVAEIKTEFLTGLNSPFGMALIGNVLYVANTDAVMRFNYTEGATKIDGPGAKLTDLPAGSLNPHWTRGLVANRDGSRLYVSVGANSNVAENGIENEEQRAVILEIVTSTGETRVFASGLRNPVGIDFEPQTSVLWAVVNERDELGSDLVPDYLTSVKDGGFYGWPYSYFGQHIDKRVEPQRPDLVAKSIVPDYALGNHVAPLGLTFAQGNRLPPQFKDGAFIGLHGSWNRRPRSGYKVVFVPFADGKPSGKPIDVVTGFVNDAGEAMGRPVGVTIDKNGMLLIADDVGNAIWRVAPAQLSANRR